ncbi:MAG: FMN-binding negative transcriptional regulator [Taibaiella sp.]|nr:FMN-binding negative transcriptional regulator [Taibaiella sp.]
MFIPKEFEITDKAEMIAFISRYNFGVIVSQKAGVPQATHLPFHVLEREGKVILTAHFAKANEQWKGIEEQEVLVIFSQPHAYISPSHYNKLQNVPTWNYMAVHVYGSCSLIHNTAKGFEILEQMMLQSEPSYMEQWKSLDEQYKTALYNGIVPFELTIHKITAAGKLSQNKTDAEKQRIIKALAASVDSAEKDIAEYMSKYSLSRLRSTCPADNEVK